MSPLAPGIGEAWNGPGTSNPPIDRWMLLCGLSSATTASAGGWMALYAVADVVLENRV